MRLDINPPPPKNYSFYFFVNQCLRRPAVDGRLDKSCATHASALVSTVFPHLPTRIHSSCPHNSHACARRQHDGKRSTALRGTAFLLNCKRARRPKPQPVPRNPPQTRTIAHNHCSHLLRTRPDREQLARPRTAPPSCTARQPPHHTTPRGLYPEAHLHRRATRCASSHKQTATAHLTYFRTHTHPDTHRGRAPHKADSHCYTATRARLKPRNKSPLCLSQKHHGHTSASRRSLSHGRTAIAHFTQLGTHPHPDTHRGRAPHNATAPATRDKPGHPPRPRTSQRYRHCYTRHTPRNTSPRRLYPEPHLHLRACRRTSSHERDAIAHFTQLGTRRHPDTHRGRARHNSTATAIRTSLHSRTRHFIIIKLTFRGRASHDNRWSAAYVAPNESRCKVRATFSPRPRCLQTNLSRYYSTDVGKGRHESRCKVRATFSPRPRCLQTNLSRYYSTDVGKGHHQKHLTPPTKPPAHCALSPLVEV